MAATQKPAKRTPAKSRSTGAKATVGRSRAAKSRAKAKAEESQLTTYLAIAFTGFSILFAVVAYVYYNA